MAPSCSSVILYSLRETTLLFTVQSKARKCTYWVTGPRATEREYAGATTEIPVIMELKRVTLPEERKCGGPSCNSARPLNYLPTTGIEPVHGC